MLDGDTFLEKLRAENIKKRPPSEMQRILGLTPRRPVSQEERAYIKGLCEIPGGKDILFPHQIEMLVGAHRMQGLYVGAGVGYGKTIVSLVVSHVIPCRYPVLLVPSRIVKEKTRREIENKYAASFNVDTRIRIMTYGELSHEHGEALLNYGPDYVRELKQGSSAAILEPLKQICDLLILDESHLVKDTANSARTGRVGRFVKKHNPKVVALTATPAPNSIVDYAHVIDWCLRDKSPLPRRSHWSTLKRWARCLDHGDFERPDARDWAEMEALNIEHGYPSEKLADMHGNEKRAAVQAAFCHRLATTEGVFFTKSFSVDVDLTYYTYVPEQPKVLQEALYTLGTKWERPDGENLWSALDVAACSSQLSLGFHYFWDWPGGVVDHDWLDARAEWGVQLRRVQKRPRQGFDTPALIRRDIIYGGRLSKDEALTRAWREWAKVRERPKPPTKTTWLSRALITDLVVKTTGRDCIIWYSDTAVRDELRRQGVNVFDGGKMPPLQNIGRIALSIKSHGTGLNLQHYWENWIVGGSRCAKTLEQVIGRTHRMNQKNDVVVIFMLDKDGPLRARLVEAKARAVAIQTREGQLQRLINYDWLT